MRTNGVLSTSTFRLLRGATASGIFYNCEQELLGWTIDCAACGRFASQMIVMTPGAPLLKSLRLASTGLPDNGQRSFTCRASQTQWRIGFGSI